MKNEIIKHRTIREELGLNIRKAREDAKLTRSALVERLCRSQLAPGNYADGGRLLKEDTLKQWELGRNSVRLDWIPALCEVLDCDPGFLFGEYPQHHRQTADICAATGLSEKAASNLKEYDYFYKVGGEKTNYPDRSGLTPSEVLSHLLESESFWRVLGNISQWTKTGVLEMARLADQYDPTAGGLPTVPSYIEPNPAMIPFEENMRELYMAAATKRFGDAVEEIFTNLLKQEIMPPAPNGDVEAIPDNRTSPESPDYYERLRQDRRRMREDSYHDVDDLIRAMQTPEK